jgi:membrane fusion protein
MALAIVAFLGLCTYSRKAQVSGVLLPADGLAPVLSMQAGWITARHVREGQHVKAGDILFSLNNERSAGAGTTAEEAIAQAMRGRKQSLERDRQEQATQFSRKVDAASRRAADLRAEASRIDGQLQLQAQRVKLAEAVVSRHEALQANGFVSAAQIHDKQAELLDQIQRALELERARAATLRDVAQLEAEISDLEIQARRDREGTSRMASSIEQELTENNARRVIAIRASRDGIVSAVVGEVGQVVLPNQVLASIIPPSSQLEAELQAPSRAAGFVRPGMAVLLRYAPYPFQKFGHANGRIRELSAAPVRFTETTSSIHVTTSEPVYRIRVTLEKQSVAAYGSEVALQPGTAVDASIVLDTRPLYEWLLDPLYSIKGRL